MHTLGWSVTWTPASYERQLLGIGATDVTGTQVVGIYTVIVGNRSGSPGCPYGN